MTATRTMLLVTFVTIAAGAGAAFAAGGGDVDAAARARAAWILERSGASAVADQRLFQAEFGGGGAAREDVQGAQMSTGLKVLASAVLPGAGEALSGYKRGYLMMAVDIFAWTQVAKYHSDGKDLSDEYYAFADAHYSDELLWLAYVDSYQNTDGYLERADEGDTYFGGSFSSDGSFSVSDLEATLSLYVTKEDDRREYYENLGKWDQFIFGWDDYTRASVDHPEYDYEPTRTISDLRQPWVSKNREIYRDMRDAANDAYQTRDRWLYVNIGLRVFSVLQTAWLNGLLGGDDGLAVLGHEVNVAAVPRGTTSGTLQATVSF